MSSSLQMSSSLPSSANDQQGHAVGPGERVYSKQQLLDLYSAGHIAQLDLNVAEVCVPLLVGVRGCRMPAKPREPRKVQRQYARRSARGGRS